MNTEEKLNLVKDFKLSYERIQIIEDLMVRVQAIPTDFDDPEVSANILLEKLVKQAEVNMLMNLFMMKNVLAMHLEHELENEIHNTKIQDQLNAAMKAMGLNPEDFKNMFK